MKHLATLLFFLSSCGAATSAPDSDTSSDGVPDADTGPRIIDIAAGNHTCVLINDGSVRCWGRNHHGQLGAGNTTDIVTANSSVAIDFGGKKATSIASANDHTCAVMDTGELYCWGGNGDGQLGYGGVNDVGDAETPAVAGPVSVGGSVAQVSPGEGYYSAVTCAIIAGGAVKCWGGGNTNAPGYGNTDDFGDQAGEFPSTRPNVNFGSGVQIKYIATGGDGTCAISNSDDLFCWGNNEYGEAGTGDSAQQLLGTPASIGIVSVGANVAKVTKGTSHTCVLTEGNAVKCWGYGPVTGLGSNVNVGGTPGTVPSALAPVALGEPAVDIVSGASFTCALLENSKDVRCWGRNDQGQLGLENTDLLGDNEIPTSSPVIDIGDEVEQIAAGARHLCALLVSGGLRCWGDGQYGQLGYGNTNSFGDEPGETPASAGDVPLMLE